MEKEQGRNGCHFRPASLERLLLPSVTQALEELVCADDLSVKSARDQSVAFDFAGLAVRDGD